MSIKHAEVLKVFDGEDYTEVSFQPDLAIFNMEKLDDSTIALLSSWQDSTSSNTICIRI